MTIQHFIFNIIFTAAITYILNDLHKPGNYSAIRAHFAFRRACFARRGIESSCVCESHGPRLISGGLQPPYPRCVIWLFF